MSTVIIISSVAGVMAIGLGFRAWANLNRDETWKSVGEALGLQFQEGGIFGSPSLSGSIDGIRIDAEILVEGSGKHRSVYSVVCAQIDANLPPSMQIRHEGFFQKFEKFFGGEDIQVGDPALDDTFIFAGSPSSAIRKLVTSPVVKSALLSTNQHCKSLRIENGEVHLKELVSGTNHDKLARYLRMSVRLANAFEEAAAPNAPLRAPKATDFPAQTAASEPTPAPASSASDDPDDWW